MSFREVTIKNITIKYDLTYKNVKNINLRMKPDGIVRVSANRWVPQAVIDEFILSKADFIIKALKRYENKTDSTPKQYFSEDEIRDVIIKLCEKVYPYFENRGINYPQIKFRKMVSRWGSCHPKKGILNFNLKLMYAPAECIEYVVLHEFTHFLQPNHSHKFYGELAKTCPDWKERRKILREINIQ